MWSPRKRRARRFRPSLEVLEDRTLPSVSLITSDITLRDPEFESLAGGGGGLGGILHGQRRGAWPAAI